MTPMAGKLYVKTFGCQMNEYDTDKIRAVLARSHGLAPVDDPEAADVLLLNTCSIREKAQEKVFSLLGRWKGWKAERPGLVIGVGGCVASQEGEALRERAPWVDLVFGPQTLHRLPQMLDAVRRTPQPVIDVSFPEIEKFDCLPEPRADGPTAYVSVMEGCSNACTYCIVPMTRGKAVSRPVADVVAEVTALTVQGVREVTLLGQNVDTYRGRDAQGGIADLGALLAEVARVPGVERLRYLTSHPQAPDRALRRDPAAGRAPAPAGAERLRPGAEADAPWLHRGRLPRQGRAAARGAPWPDAVVRFHRRLPRRERRRLPGDP
jgi:tRNA-2-methylthio-N6-dimethylallyladenosine synthase